MTAPVVEFLKLGKAIGACRAVDDVSASFEPQKIHAILGENGAGKSTLMKLLFGLISPTEGRLKVEGIERSWGSPADAIAAGLGMVQQHFTLVDSLSVIDNVMLGYESVSFGGILDRDRAIQEIENALPSKALSLDWNRLVGDLAVGEKQKVEILKLIARKSRILVLDEPTAVLSPQEIEGLFAILKDLRNQGRTIFVITHKLGEVFDHCDTWFVLRGGKSISAGEVRSTKVEDVVKAMVGSAVQPLAARSEAKLGVAVLNFAKVSGVESANPIRDLSFEIRAGEILGIAGIDGSGQAEIVASLLGIKKFAGSITVLGTAMPNSVTASVAARSLAKLRSSGLAVVSEDRHEQGLWLEESPNVNAVIGFERQNGLVKRGLIRKSKWRETAREWMKSFDVRFLSESTSVARLSGGNQQKLVFARELLSRSPKLIVVHQPTRGVDFNAIRLIHERIIAARDAGVAVLVISSELDELMALSDRILVICAGRETGAFRRSFTGPAFNREMIGRAMTGSK